MPQTLDQKLDVLGSFAAADRIRSVWGAKLLVDQAGDMHLQEAGFSTFWSRRAADSLTNVYGTVGDVFSEACTAVQMARFQNAGDAGNELAWRTLYAYKGYSTLVRKGYGSNAVLRGQVTQLGRMVGRACVPIACNGSSFDQSRHIPAGSQGMCYGFTVDWLRRCYKQKYGYGFGHIDTRQGEVSVLAAKGKLAAVAGIQENQSLIRNDGSRRGNLTGMHVSMLRDVPIVSNRLSTPAGARLEAAYADRFAGMTLHQERPFLVPQQDRRCCGVGPVGHDQEPQTVQAIIQAMTQDMVSTGNNPCGWLITLCFADFFTGAPESGHAIGMFFEGQRTGRFICFDSNHGTVETPVEFIALRWLRFSILRWSLCYSVPSVTLNRVSTR